MVDAPVAHAVVFWCEQPNAASKNYKLSLFDITQLTLVRSLSQFQNEVKAHETKLKQQNPQIRLMLIVVTPKSALLAISRGKHIHPDIFNRLFLLGELGQVEQISPQDLDRCIVAEEKSQRDLALALKTVSASLIKDKSSSKYYTEKCIITPKKPKIPTSQSIQTKSNQSFSIPLENLNNVSQSVRKFFSLPPLPKNHGGSLNRSLNLNHSVINQSFICHSMMHVPAGLEESQKSSPINIVAEIEKQEKESWKKKKKNLGSYQQIDLQLKATNSVPNQSAPQKNEPLKSQSALEPQTPKKEQQKIEQIIKQKINAIDLNKINQSVLQEGNQEKISESLSQESENLGSDEDVQRSCYSRQIGDEEDGEDEGEGEKVIGDVLERLSEKSQHNSSEQHKYQYQQQQQQQPQCQSELNELPQQKLSIQEDIQQKEEEFQDNLKQPEEEKKQEFSIDQEQEPEQNESLEEETQKSEESQYQQAHQSTQNLKKSANPITNIQPTLQITPMTPIIPQSLHSQQEKPLSPIPQQKNIIRNNNQQQIDKIKQLPMNLKVKISREPLIEVQNNLKREEELRQQEVDKKQVQAKAHLGKVKAAYDKLRNRLERNKNAGNWVTTPRQIYQRREIFKFIDNEISKKIVPRAAPKKPAEQKPFKSMSIIWADSNPNLGVTESLFKKFGPRLTLQKTETISYEIIQKIHKNPTNEYILMCNNRTFFQLLTNKFYCSFPFPNCKTYIVYCMNQDIAYGNIEKFSPDDQVLVTVCMEECYKLVVGVVEREYRKIYGREM